MGDTTLERQIRSLEEQAKHAPPPDPHQYEAEFLQWSFDTMSSREQEQLLNLLEDLDSESQK